MDISSNHLDLLSVPFFKYQMAEFTPCLWGFYVVFQWAPKLPQWNIKKVTSRKRKPNIFYVFATISVLHTFFLLSAITFILKNSCYPEYLFYMFSREIEHCEENMELLFDMFYGNDWNNPQKLIKSIYFYWKNLHAFHKNRHGKELLPPMPAFFRVNCLPATRRCRGSDLAPSASFWKRPPGAQQRRPSPQRRESWALRSPLRFYPHKSAP